MPEDRYRLYVDECGDHVFHDRSALTRSGHRFLALVGCFFSLSKSYGSFHQALEQLKQRHFPRSPDDDAVILHRTDIIDGRRAFWRLRDDARRSAFDDELCSLLEEADFMLVGICIDKLRLLEQYPQPFHPYHVALGFMLQRYCGWLGHMNRMGDVMAESRGGREDLLLANAYSHIWTHGDQYHPSAFFRRTLSSEQLKLKRKSQNIAGLQLADLLAHAVRDDILLDHGCCPEHESAFEARLLRAVRPKYNCHLYDRRVQGYGKVLFPK